MKLKKITNILDEIAPPNLAQDWDNVGLLAGDYNQNIKKVMLTVDMTTEVFAEAKAAKVDLLIAYHPPIWEPIKQVVADCGPSPLLYAAIRSGMAIYALHTALDSVRGGINDLLAQIVGIKNPQPLQAVRGEKMCKLVVFLPESDLTRVSEAIFATGAGNVGEKGKYSKCSFRCRGVGTFQCGRSSNPTIGKPGRFEQVDELRLETVVPQEKIAVVTAAMLGAHSYEEVAYDIIPLLEAPADIGLGRFGDLEEPTTVVALTEKIKKALKVKTAGLIGPARRQVKRAAVGAGSCGTLLRQVIKQNCNFYLTGELKHHHALELQAAGLTTLCVGHSHSERIILPRIAQRLRRSFPGLTVTLSRKDRDPFTWA